MSEALLLREFSPRDAKFDKFKYQAMLMADTLSSGRFAKLASKSAAAKFSGYAKRVSSCCQNLTYAVTGDGLKLRQTFWTTKNGQQMPVIRFCRVRGCPTCQWRRSLMWQSRAFAAVPKIVDAYPGHSFLFLTLTVKNCLYSELRQTIDQMQAAWKQLVKPFQPPRSKSGRLSSGSGNPNWTAIGYAKSLEVTLGNVEGSCHPHFHALLLVPNSYFRSSSYLKIDPRTGRNDWADMWAKYMKLDYRPIVDCRKVNSGDSGAIPEVFKYESKGSELLGSEEFLEAYLEQMHRVRSIELGGVFRQFMRDDVEDSDLINADEQLMPAEHNCQILTFQWKRHQVMSNEVWNYEMLQAA